MKVWKQFDVDCSGYIEADELKQFVKALLNKRQGSKISEEKLIEYTDTIVGEHCRASPENQFCVPPLPTFHLVFFSRF